MKNLANCKPSEFLKQTNLIRKSVANWLELTDVLNIRQKKPDLSGLDEKEKRAALEAQAKENLNEMLEAILEEHPEETLEVLALICFVEPEDADNHSVAEYLDALSEIISNKAVLNFFISLARLEKTPTSSVSRA